MEFSGINEVAKKSDYLPTKKMQELEVDGDYLITDIRPANTKYGRKFIAEVRCEFTVFLPSRVSDILNADTNVLGELVKSAHAGQLNMKYLGGKLNGIEFQRISI